LLVAGANMAAMDKQPISPPFLLTSIIT
jgi:hypothetical protein